MTCALETPRGTNVDSRPRPCRLGPKPQTHAGTGYEGCRYLGSCGSKKVEDEDSNLQPQYKESNCIATKLRSPKSLDLS